MLEFNESLAGSNALLTEGTTVFTDINAASLSPPFYRVGLAQ